MAYNMYGAGGGGSGGNFDTLHQHQSMYDYAATGPPAPPSAAASAYAAQYQQQYYPQPQYQPQYQQQQQQAAYPAEQYHQPQQPYPTQSTVPSDRRVSPAAAPASLKSPTVTSARSDRMPNLASTKEEKEDQRIRGDEKNAFSGSSPQPYDDDGPKKKAGFFAVLYAYLCCCIPKSFAGRIICGSITFIILAGLAVVGYLYIPRFPDIKVLSIEQRHANAFEFLMDPQYPNNYNKMTLKLNLNMNVSVYNSNPYHMIVELIDLHAYLMINQSALQSQGIKPAVLGLDKYIGPAPVGADANYSPSMTPQIGFSNTSNLVFPSRLNYTFPMQFNLVYQPDSMLGLIKDPIFAEVVNVCGLLGTARPALISYQAKTTVSTLKNLGYLPVVSGQIRIRCPVTTQQLSDLEDAVKSGTDLLQALKDAFGGSSSGGSSSNTTTTTSGSSASGETKYPFTTAALLAKMAEADNNLLVGEQEHSLHSYEYTDTNIAGLLY
ncbi:hypothetical protein DFJ73DRAFT_873464 [Zopfochytrium polystomum]|nr:hypothetical protein DFJ73DRAFT_873464 [Zopfochytrium polystomum]